MQMNKYNLMFQDDGAKSNDINDSSEIGFESDEDASCEDTPDDGSSQNEIDVSISIKLSELMSIDPYEPPKHETQTIITVQTVSQYGSNEKFTPRDLNLRPGTHAPGEDHRISVDCFARISGQDAKAVATWARDDRRFLELDFHFPGLRLPLFTIRVLVSEDQQEDISLSGGLGFAHRALKAARAFDLEGISLSPRRRLPPPVRKRLAQSSGPWHKRHWRTPGPAIRARPFTLRDIEHITGSPPYLANFTQSRPPPAPLPRSLPSLPDTDDQLSVSTDYTEDSMEAPPLTLSTTETNWLDSSLDNTEEPFETSPGEILKTNFPFLGITEDWASCHAKGQQYSVESFEQQKRKAEAMYAHNGDTSGMVAMMTLASASSFSNYADISYNATKN